MRIVMIGSGNVATVLSRKISAAGSRIIQVYSRNRNNAKDLGAELGAPYTDNISTIDRQADLYIVSVSDNALGDIAGCLTLDDQLIAHTAGSISRDALKQVSSNYGVLYPLQSLRKETVIIPEIPFLIDGNTAENITRLTALARRFSNDVQVADDQTRLKLHVAAIIANNFTNHLFTLAEDFCIRENVDFRLLMPMILELSGRLKFDSRASCKQGRLSETIRKLSINIKL